MRKCTGLLMLMLIGATTQPAKTIAEYVKDLADANAEVREKARFELMGLSKEQLPELKAAVMKAEPLLPAQVSALHDVVLQVVCRDAVLHGETISVLPQIDPKPPKEQEPKNREEAFMLERRREEEVANAAARKAKSPNPLAKQAFMGVRITPDERDGDPQRPSYVRIDSRIVGFNGYRYLCDGDVITKVREFENEAPGGVTFGMNVKKLSPGAKLTLTVLRQGRSVTVVLPLDAAPPIVTEQQLVNLTRDRLSEAEDYWRQEFGAAEGSAN